MTCRWEERKKPQGRETNSLPLNPRFSPCYSEMHPSVQVFAEYEYTRKHATHNRYFDTPSDLCDSLFKTFGDIRKNPKKISGLLRPYF
jgi:hypothetical protein